MKFIMCEEKRRCILANLHWNLFLKWLFVGYLHTAISCIFSFYSCLHCWPKNWKFTSFNHFHLSTCQFQPKSFQSRSQYIINQKKKYCFLLHNVSKILPTFLMYKKKYKISIAFIFKWGFLLTKNKIPKTTY